MEKSCIPLLCNFLLSAFQQNDATKYRVVEVDLDRHFSLGRKYFFIHFSLNSFLYIAISIQREDLRKVFETFRASYFHTERVASKDGTPNNVKSEPRLASNPR